MSSRERLRAVALVSVAFIGLAPAAPAGEEAVEKKALATVERLGGQVLRKGDKPDGAVREVRLLGKKVTDADLKDLAAFKEMEWLLLTDSAVTDAGLKHLARCERLAALSLSGSKVTDAGLKELTRLKG